MRFHRCARTGTTWFSAESVMNRMLRRTAVLGALCSAALAFAHPALVSSTPKSGEALASPTELRLRFSEPIEPAFTHVELVDPGGLELKVGALSAVKDDANAITIVLPALAPGIYKARWSAAGRDGHRVKGEFSFTVK